MCKSCFLVRYSQLIRFLSYAIFALLLSSCGGGGGSGDSDDSNNGGGGGGSGDSDDSNNSGGTIVDTMEFVVTVPMNTSVEDTIFLQSGGAPSASFKMEKNTTNEWRVNISEQMITDKGATFNFGTKELSYAYTRGVDLMNFAGAEFFDDDPDNGSFSLKRKATFSGGTTQTDTVQRWRYSLEDGQSLLEIPAQLTNFEPRLNNSEFQAGIQVNDFWTAPWVEGGSGNDLIESTSSAIENVQATWVQITPNWDYQQKLPTPIIHAHILPDPSTLLPHTDDMASVGSYNEADLRAHIQNARSHGFKVLLRIGTCCNTANADDIPSVGTEWWDEWFAQYENFILFHAVIAEEEGADAIVLAPLTDPSLFPNAPGDRVQRWEALHAQWELAFSGQLGYEIFAIGPCCNYLPAVPYFNDGIEDISHLFDFIGISIFQGIAEDGAASQATLDSNAEALFTGAFDPIHTASGLPIIVPSLAYASFDGGATSDAGVDDIGLAQFEPEGLTPWLYDGIEQAMAYQAIMKAVAKRPHITGIYPFGYNWVSTPLTPDFSIRGKAAEKLLAEWYGHISASFSP